MNSLLNLLPDNVINALSSAPMPSYNGIEPTEIELMKIQKYIGLGKFDELSEEHQKWVCGRLMPSLVRFGCYPPPEGL